MGRNGKGITRGDNGVGTGRENDPNSGPRSKLYDEWNQLSSTMGDQMKALAKEGNAIQNGWQEKWLKLYNEAREDLAKAAEGNDGHSLTALSGVWNQYSTRMMAMLDRMVETGNGTYSSVQHALNNHLPKIETELSKTLNGNVSEMKPYDQYKMWMDLANEQLQGLQGTMGMTNDVTRGALDLWQSMDSEMRRVLGDIANVDGPAYGELNRKWAATSAEMNRDLRGFLEDYSKRFSALQEGWSKFSSDITIYFMDLMRANDIEETYRRYTEGLNGFLQIFGVPTFTGYTVNPRVREDMDDLKKRIEDLENIMKEKRK